MPTLKQNTYKSALAALTDYLADHDMRLTLVRQIVVNEMCQLPQPFTAEQLVEACKDDRISTATIYNTLELLLKAHILHATERQYGRTAVQYEIATGEGGSHMTLVCRKCGREMDFHDKAISRLLQERKYSNFNLRRYSLIVYGECKICRRHKNKPNV